MYKSYKSLCFTLLILASCTSFALMHEAFAATNPEGVTASGMAATIADPILNNYGTILGGLKTEHAGSQAGSTFITYAGMLGRTSSSANYTFNNFGKITIHRPGTDSIVGMLADSTIAGSHMLNNSGTINISGGDNVHGMSATTGGTGNQKVVNSGTITTSGNNTISGMFASSSNGNNTIINTNDINVSGFGTVYGMNAIGNGNHNLNSSGIISINGTGAEIYGMSAKGTGNHTLTNSNTITVTGGSGDDIYGMSAEGIGIHNLDNSGTINVKSVSSKVHGMHAQSSLDFSQNIHSVNNSGTITVSGLQSIYGIYAEVKSGLLNVNNSGTIEASGTNLVFGMYVAQVQGGNATHSVTNTGYISARATNGIAFEVYGTTDYNVNTWATTLRNWSINDTVFGVIDTQTINFNNSTLIVRPGTAAQGFALGKSYNVADMIGLINQNSFAIPSSSTNIAGTIINAITEVPFLTATLTNGNDPFTATVRIDSNLNENTTTGSTTMQQAVAQVQGQFNSLSTSLRNALVKIYTQANLVADAKQNSTSGLAAGSDFIPQDKWQVFITPYVNNLNNNDLDYAGNSIGITGGATYRVNEQFSFGGHLDFNYANYSADIMSMDTKSTSFALGLHAAFNITPEWYLRGQLTGSVSQNNGYYKAEVDTPLSASANYSGEAIYAALSTAYIWQLGQGHSLTPEIGLSYLSAHTSAYDVAWSGIPSADIYDLSYDDSYYNAFYANFNLDWRSEWELENNTSFALMIGAGLRHKLSNNEMITSVSMLGSKLTTQYTEDATTFLLNAGMEYDFDNFSISLNYDGGFGTYQTTHGGNIMVKFEF